MIWVGISGSWRNPVPDGDVEREVLLALEAGKGIVTGGALGVDYRAAVTAVRYDPSRLRIILPTSLETFLNHHFRRVKQGVLTHEQVNDLAWVLTGAQERGCVEEHPERKTVGRTSYYARNQDVVNMADELIAFRVNNSAGTGDTIRRAKEKSIPVRVFTYSTYK